MYVQRWSTTTGFGFAVVGCCVCGTRVVGVAVEGLAVVGNGVGGTGDLVEGIFVNGSGVGRTVDGDEVIGFDVFGFAAGIFVDGSGVGWTSVDGDAVQLISFTYGCPFSPYLIRIFLDEQEITVRGSPRSVPATMTAPSDIVISAMRIRTTPGQQYCCSVVVYANDIEATLPLTVADADPPSPPYVTPSTEIPSTHDPPLISHEWAAVLSTVKSVDWHATSRRATTARCCTTTSWPSRVMLIHIIDVRAATAPT